MAGHSRLAASASSRWLKCPGSINLIEILKKAGKIPESTTTSAAELGTAVHYIIEQVLLGNKKVRDFRGARIKEEGMTKPVVITSKEIRSAKVCIKYVLNKMKKHKRTKMFPERKYDLSDVYQAPIGGTSDITLIYRDGLLEIADYKNGKWSVHVVGNTQLRIYALGAWYTFRDKYNIKSIKLTIVQPNCGHDDGPIRSETFSVDELIDWERSVLVPGLADIKSPRAKLVPNEKEQCTWCEAKAHCEARKKQKPKFVKDILGDLIPTTSIDTLPEMVDLSEKELKSVLLNADKVIEFYLEAKKYAVKVLEDKTQDIDGWSLVPKLSNRKFIDKKSLRKKLLRKKIDIEDLTVHLEDRMMTVTELEKHLLSNLKWDKSDAKIFMDKITERTPNGNVLVKVDDAQDDFAEFAH